jgi:hypothetical protein
MTGKNFSIGILTGLLLGSLSVIWLSGVVNPRVMAQAPAQQSAATQRYQLTSWAHGGRSSGGNSDNSGNQPSFGAYILDTQSGKVWGVMGHERPKLLGGIE